MSFSFNGTSQYLQNSNDPLGGSSTPCTISAWFRSNSASAEQRILSIGDTGGSDEIFAGLNAGICQFSMRSAGTANADTSNSYSINTWHHIFCVSTAADDRTCWLDMDDANKGTSATSKSPGSIDAARIGVRSRASLSGYFDGEIELVTLWDAALTLNEGISIYQGDKAPYEVRRSNIVGLWQCIGKHSPSPDLSGNAYNMTLTNTPTIDTGAPARLFRTFHSFPLIETGGAPAATPKAFCPGIIG